LVPGRGVTFGPGRPGGHPARRHRRRRAHRTLFALL